MIRRAGGQPSGDHHIPPRLPVATSFRPFRRRSWDRRTAQMHRWRFASRQRPSVLPLRVANPSSRPRLLRAHLPHRLPLDPLCLSVLLARSPSGVPVRVSGPVHGLYVGSPVPLMRRPGYTARRLPGRATRWAQTLGRRVPSVQPLRRFARCLGRRRAGRGRSRRPLGPPRCCRTHCRRNRDVGPPRAGRAAGRLSSVQPLRLVPGFMVFRSGAGIGRAGRLRCPG